MKKKFLILTAVVAINAIAISSFMTNPAQAEGTYDGQYEEFPCFCEGVTFPDPMEWNVICMFVGLELNGLATIPGVPFHVVHHLKKSLHQEVDISKW